MHPRPGKLREAARVVGIQVRDDDVADILGREAEAPDLGRGGLVGVALGTQEEAVVAAEPAAGIGDLRGAQARVDEDQALGRFDEEAVTDEPSAPEPGPGAVDEPCERRAQRRAVEVMNPQRQPPPPVEPPWMPPSVSWAGSRRRSSSPSSRPLISRATSLTGRPEA